MHARGEPLSARRTGLWQTLCTRPTSGATRWPSCESLVAEDAAAFVSGMPSPTRRGRGVAPPGSRPFAPEPQPADPAAGNTAAHSRAMLIRGAHAAATLCTERPRVIMPCSARRAATRRVAGRERHGEALAWRGAPEGDHGVPFVRCGPRIWTHPHSHIQGMPNLYQASTSATMLSTDPHIHIHGGSAGGATYAWPSECTPVAHTYVLSISMPMSKSAPIIHTSSQPQLHGHLYSFHTQY